MPKSLYCRLSAYLYEATRQKKYRDAAELSAHFLRTHLYNNTVVIDRMDVMRCNKTASQAQTYVTGLMIEGMSVLANTTRNATLDALYVHPLSQLQSSPQTYLSE